MAAAGQEASVRHVRFTLTAGGREAEFHPMYDLLANSPFVERAKTTHWNYSGETLGIRHYVEGDAELFEDAVESFPEVTDFELTRVDEGPSTRTSCVSPTRRSGNRSRL